MQDTSGGFMAGLVVTPLEIFFYPIINQRTEMAGGENGLDALADKEQILQFSPAITPYKRSSTIHIDGTSTNVDLETPMCWSYA